MTDLIGQRLGQYEITGLLGKGGMATVYRARQLNIKRDVAIKVIKPGLTNSDTILKRFEREAEMIASLSHPHILKLFDYGKHEDTIYLVTELLGGGSLDDLLEQGPLPAEQTAHILDQIAAALDYAHERGIIHRDLKPANVLLDEKGNAFLTDFGIARIVDDNLLLTQDGIAMGTPPYMSPEQWSSPTIDSRADLYALGIVVFEMLTGSLPFSADTPFRLMHMHLYEAPPALHTLRPELPETVGPVMDKAMAKDREQRFASAVAFSMALKDALAGILQPQMAPTQQHKTIDNIDRQEVTRPEFKTEAPAEPITPWFVAPGALFPPPPLGDTQPVPTYEKGSGKPHKRSWRLILILLILIVVLVGLLIGIYGNVRSGPEINPSDGDLTNQALTATVDAALPAVVTATQLVLPPLITEVTPVGSKSLATGSATDQASISGSHAAGDTRVDPKGIAQVWVPAGCFKMGSTRSTGTYTQADEQPQHDVCLTHNYWLDEYAVTNAAYQDFIDAGGYSHRDYWSAQGWQWVQTKHITGPMNFTGFTDPKQPRVGISWYEAEAYAHWRGGRLPTEAEWEYAAAGPKSLLYPWGNTYEAGRANVVGTGTKPVGSYESGRSWVGAYDMVGNAWQWIADWYSDTYYVEQVKNDPPGPATGTGRVLRGGAWNNNQINARNAFRGIEDPAARFNVVGVRVVTP